MTSAKEWRPFEHMRRVPRDSRGHPEYPTIPPIPDGFSGPWIIYSIERGKRRYWVLDGVEGVSRHRHEATIIQKPETLRAWLNVLIQYGGRTALTVEAIDEHGDKP